MTELEQAILAQRKAPWSRRGKRDSRRETIPCIPSVSTGSPGLLISNTRSKGIQFWAEEKSTRTGPLAAPREGARMSDQVHTADVCPDCDGLGRLLDLSFDPGRNSSSVRCGACCGAGRIHRRPIPPPQPDEWGGLDLDAELARIEANLARWEEDLSVPEADELADRIAKDADTLVAVLRRADRVIRAQGRDLAEVRQAVARSQEELNDAINQLEYAQRQLADEWPDLWVDDEDSDWPEDDIDDLIVADRLEDLIPPPRPLTADEVTL